MIDIGVNFGDYSSQKVSVLLREFVSKGGRGVVSISNSPKEIPHNIKHTERVHIQGCPLYFTAGCHPHNAKNMRAEQYDIIRQSFSNPNCVAVGEMGLDYNRMFSPKEDQLSVFRTQVRLARELNKPMYLHVRDAFDDFVQVIREEEYARGVVHCFTGNLEQACILTGLGFKLGITGWLLDKRRNEELVDAIRSENINLFDLLIETDAPYMAIKGRKKLVFDEEIHIQKNESVPSDIEYVATEIARLKGVSKEDCMRILFRNTLDVFGIEEAADTV